MTFTRATKTQARLRLGLIGPSGSGKTYSALGIASGLGEKVALIDTERRSASKYADTFLFDVMELESFEPERFIAAIKAAETANYDVLIIDSLSHAWMGKGGILELADTETKRSRSGNSFNVWREVTPKHNALVDTILRSSCHVIATLRTKTEYVIEKDERSGKSLPRKVGLAPVQRDGLEYEFDIVGDLDSGDMIIGKTRCSLYAKAIIHEPGASMGKQLKSWLDSVPAPLPVAPPPILSQPNNQEPEQSAKLKQLKNQIEKVHGSQVVQVKPEEIWTELVALAADRGISTKELGDIIYATTKKTSQAQLTSEDRVPVRAAIDEIVPF